FWPVDGLTSLTFDQSVAQGVVDLNAGIEKYLPAGPVAVFGYSESATVATDEMRALDALPAGVRPDPSQLAFTLVGNPNNPDGGILERFVGLHIPILDVSFNGATPPDTPYPTDIFTIQYDGVPDAPQYPINLPSDLNALLGYFYLHSQYPTLPNTAFNASGVTPCPGPCVPLPTSPGYDGVTHYYEMLTQNLPLLDPLRQIPVAGNPLAELVQPDFRVIVDLGYGDGYANVPTPAGLFPLVNPITVGSELLTGAQQGVVASLVDVGLLPSTDLPTTYPYLPLAQTPGEIQLPGILSALSDPSGTVSSLLSSPTSLPQDLLNLLGGSGLSSLSSDILGLGSELTSLLQGLDLPGSLLALPNALGFALDPMMLLAPLALLGL
ncbi:MAG: PE-PPE domain-containing protein, partial [Mycobacterium sp.]|nr:PE-PPE domain-containing protein [Mycobacterium sp.]